MQCSICPPWARMTRVSRFENWSMAVSTKSSSSSLVWRSPFPVTLQRIFNTCLKKCLLVVFCCNFWTLQQKPHDYICSGCKNVVSQKCAVFIGPPCTHMNKVSVCFVLRNFLSNLPYITLWIMCGCFHICGQELYFLEHYFEYAMRLQWPCINTFKWVISVKLTLAFHWHLVHFIFICLLICY